MAPLNLPDATNTNTNTVDPAKTDQQPDPQQVAANADPVNVDSKPPVDKNEQDKTSFELSDDFWQNKTENATQDNKPDATVTATQTGPTQSEIFDEHVKSLNFAPEQISDEQVAALFDNRDLSVLVDLINQGGRAAYKQAMQDTASLVAAGEKKAEAAARQMTATQMGERDDMHALNTALPFTTNKAVAPVAQAVFKQSLSKDQSRDKAIESVRNFFAATAHLGQKELGLDPAPKPNPGDAGFNGNNQDSADEIDWEKVISQA